mmetsp:Transcript_3635/g.7550  ORF Transcript_3635/g.7550 Transcript_3635/m.7550 type:complete len:187 (-) Transcript_3635:159-719(-)|eukprot:CAMPEP_0118933758 /NCGR_PEP_ID=MMETSP1169-20130426/12377_1 /TAXON_ID=36882 /ORGANISM="Pyramimonas obovata, Strain CCMP722" /LENGTH=186 /DNA_ID=CAMNT_0006876567 /DNA_START=111 /DNA_END=671 /DNA_ORIENTATION=+
MWTTVALTNPVCLRTTTSIHTSVRKSVHSAWPSKSRHQGFGLKRASRPHVKICRVSAAEEQSTDGDEREAAVEVGLTCVTTEEGLLLCNRQEPDAKFLVRRLEDTAEMKGKGGMIENWFLEGHAANAYCTVNDDGTLVCNLFEEGNYIVKEISPEGEAKGLYLIECSKDEDGKVTYETRMMSLDEH